MRALATASTGAHLSDWERFATDAYLDHRHRNWILSEEMGDVRFQPEAGVVLVHRVRAEHIVRELVANTRPVRVRATRVLPATTPPARMRPVPMPAPRSPHTAPRSPHMAPPSGVVGHDRWRVLWGLLGLGAGATVFVAALAIRLDDSALLLALAMLLRGGRLIL
jgi:hypothetical protein